jgi:phosphopantetheine adenylyltransferase
MALTNAERQRRYRERQLLNNKEEYEKKISLKMKKHYRKIKNEDIEENEEEKEEIITPLKAIKRRINPLNKSKLSENTIKIYLRSIRKIYKNYNKKEIEDDSEIIKLLRNEPYNLEKITLQLEFVKTDLINVIKENYKDIRNLYAVITRIKNFAKQVKELYPYIEKKQNIYNENRKNKEVNKNVERRMEAISFRKEDILKILSNEILHLTETEKLIFALMTLFPTRRAVDYRKMLISDTKPKKENKLKMNERNNYYYKKEFYFNVTKNKDIQQFEVPEELDKIINEIIVNKDTDDKHLLLNNEKKEYSTSSLSIFIMRTFNKIYGISISAVEIRRLYSTYLKEEAKNGNITEEEHRKICEKMNHSYEENKKYAYH